jgi:hypothetical protein
MLGCPASLKIPMGRVSQNLMNRLAPLRRQWDLAVLASLAAGTGRPGDLIEAITAQACDGRRIGWKVLNDTLRRLERSGYVARQEMPGAARDPLPATPARAPAGLRAQPARHLVRRPRARR